jgi:pimeloyl-ACP methyl ester carboxylesterase
MDTFHYADNQQRRIHYGLLEDGLRYEDFPDVRQAALLIHGRNDDVVPCAVSEEFVAGRPNATLTMVDSGHELTDQMEFMWGKVAAFFAAG